MTQTVIDSAIRQRFPAEVQCNQILGHLHDITLIKALTQASEDVKRGTITREMYVRVRNSLAL